MNADAVFDAVVLALSFASVVAYLCRLDMLTYANHLPGIVLMHGCLAATCAMAGAHAWLGEAGAGDAFAVAGALLWIRVSYSSWRGGVVPAHFDSGPVPLDDHEQAAS